MKSNKGFSFIAFLVCVIIIGAIIKFGIPQYKIMKSKWQMKEVISTMQQWIEAKDNWNKAHGSFCKTMGYNGICTSLPDGSDLGVHWPSDWVEVNIFTKKEKPCGNSLTCTNHYFSCSAFGSVVRCGTGKIVLEGGGNSFLNPIPNQISCTPLHDAGTSVYEEEDALCKKISGKEPVKSALGTGKNYYPL